MILTVTCNPAVDVTYTVDSLTPGEVHRVSSVVQRPGGKGVNVARVLTQLGMRTTATGFADPSFAAAVHEAGVATDFVEVLPAVRRTLVIHAGTDTTSLWEPGPVLPDGAEDLLRERVDSLLDDATALVVSGSLPQDTDPALPATLARLARKREVPVVLDLDDEPLRAALQGTGAVLVPNRDELARLVDDASVEPAVAARELSASTGAPVVVTLGAEGMLAVADGECWQASPPEQVSGNPTGAGDSAAAAIARGLTRSEPWPEILADAVALSAAAVLAPVAGEVLLDAYERWRPQVSVVDVPSVGR